MSFIRTSKILFSPNKPNGINHVKQTELSDFIDLCSDALYDEVLAKGVVADVCAVLEELVEVLGREPVPERRADPGSIEPVGDLLHGDSVGVGVEDLGDDRGCLGVRDVALVAVHGEAEDLVAVAQGSLGVVVLASSDVG